ncbi:MAG: glycosyltransferase family 2 protein [Gemmataceae bacterium]|nr:glycosyltransferase family 2 protein [Gemmataceae bacterium]
MISIVIPVYNECESLALLHEEIVASTRRAGLEYEVVFVDDGSRDGSWEVIAGLAARYPEVHGVRLRRNFGKAAALAAGFAAARGEIILTLDADLQDDPAEIPNFLAALAQGRDVVSGWKKKRLDPWHKVWPSRVFNFLVSWTTGVKLHDHNCGMKCYRAAIFREIRLYGELHRFIPVLAAARGFRVGEIAINHRPRRFGQSKYGVRRFLKGFLDLLTVKFLTGFGQRPQHLIGTIGLVSFVAGNLALLYLLATWLINHWSPGTFLPVHERALPTFALAALILGAQMMSIGFLAELIIAYQSGDQLPYSVAERTEPAAVSSQRVATNSHTTGRDSVPATDSERASV